jgi:hypothetical protein
VVPVLCVVLSFFSALAFVDVFQQLRNALSESNLHYRFCVCMRCRLPRYSLVLCTMCFSFSSFFARLTAQI